MLFKNVFAGSISICGLWLNYWNTAILLLYQVFNFFSARCNRNTVWKSFTVHQNKLQRFTFWSACINAHTFDWSKVSGQKHKKWASAQVNNFLLYWANSIAKKRCWNAFLSTKFPLISEKTRQLQQHQTNITKAKEINQWTCKNPSCTCVLGLQHLKILPLSKAKN